MSQKIVKIPHVGPFKAFEFEQSVRAKKGSKQDRIHVLGYGGKKGKDPYAVAASRMDFSSDAEAKLGWWDRRFCVLHKHDDVWYKININSFKKRIKPVNALNIDVNTGVCSNLKELIPVPKTSPVAVNQFQEMKVHKVQAKHTSCFSFETELVRDARPLLADLLDYCENHEFEIVTKLNSLALPMDLSQCKIKISPKGRITHKADIVITFPYHLIHASNNENWFENDYGQMETGGFINFSLTTRELNADPSPKENFTDFIEDLSKTFKPWFETVKTLANCIETDVFSDLILDSDPWKEFEHKQILKPAFSGNKIFFGVHLDKDQKIKWDLGFNLKFKFKNSHLWCLTPSVTMEYLSSASFDTLIDLWKNDFPKYLKKFLDETTVNYFKPTANFSDYLSDLSNLKCADIDFTELDELLELNGELTSLEIEQKYSDLKDLLKQKGRAALLKWHPDKARLNGLDPIICGEKIGKLQDLLKNANDYLDSKI